MISTHIIQALNPMTWLASGNGVFWPSVCFFEMDPMGPSISGIILVDEDDEVDPEKEKMLVCAQCKTPITRESARISVNGGHEHSFFNPHGIVYQIGCFNEAPGCHPMSMASSDFSWFPGYSWRISCCQGCQNHLGWDFGHGSSVSFYGLILDRLSSPS